MLLCRAIDPALPITAVLGHSLTHLQFLWPDYCSCSVFKFDSVRSGHGQWLEVINYLEDRWCPAPVQMLWDRFMMDRHYGAIRLKVY